MRAFREIESSTGRVLGALMPVDAGTGAPIGRGLEISALGPGRAGLLRNRSGLTVIRDWTELPAHATAFEAPLAAPAPGSLTLRVSIRDPLGQYLPRIAAVALPRDPSAAQAGSETSLFQPLRVPMYPASSAATGANWSQLRVSLAESGSGDALGGALLLLRRNGEVMARGLTDARGEALVAIVGVPVTTFSDDENAVVVSQIDVQLTAIFDTASGTRTPAGASPASAPLVDPVAIESRAASLPSVSVSLSIAARRSQHRALSLDLS